MSVKYVGGGGGLFSNLLPTLFKMGGAAVGGPVGAAIGSGLGAAVSGGGVGDILGSAATGFLGADKGGAANFQNPNVFNSQALGNAFNQQSTPFAGWTGNYDPNWYELNKKYGGGA